LCQHTHLDITNTIKYTKIISLNSAINDFVNSNHIYFLDFRTDSISLDKKLLYDAIKVSFVFSKRLETIIHDKQ